jgi:nucleoside-diphosphate-sugar epimerase
VSQLSVFGGTGFVGSHFVDHSNFDCTIIDRDARKPLTNESLFLISTTHNYHVFEDVHIDIDTNLSLLVDVLSNLAPGKSVFNFISSWFVYGDAELPASEESPLSPKGFYSITKMAAEKLVESYCRTFKIDFRILRLSNIYGVGDKSAGKKKNALSFLINEIKENKEINLYHNGEFFRDYLHLDDAVRAIDLVLKDGNVNEVYNIGGGEKILFKDVIDSVFQITNSTSKIKIVEPAEFHKIVQVKDFYMNCDKLKKLGFEQKVSIKEGIKSLCQ